MIEANLFDDYHKLKATLKSGKDLRPLTWYLVGFMIFSFTNYSVIPYFVRRSGATLLNISIVTTTLWGMLSDITVFNRNFYILYVIAFLFELSGVILFSSEKPIENK